MNHQKKFSKTFEDVNGYEDLVMLKDIAFNSHCEHLALGPIEGKVHLAYIPTDKVVGISKLARTVDIFAKSLQTQETMTQQIADCINNALKPKGVAVYIEAFHQCMTTRGVMKPNVSTITNCFIGDLKKKSISNKDSLITFLTDEYIFGNRNSVEEVEEGNKLQPKFDEKGLIPAITVDNSSKEILNARIYE